VLGLALGIAFLTGFGLGPAAVVVWLGVGLVVLTRHSITLVAFLAILVLVSTGAVYGVRQDAGNPTSATPGSFEGTIKIADGPYLTRSGQRFLAHVETMPDLAICAYAESTPRAFTGDLMFASGQIAGKSDLSAIGQAAAGARGCDAQLSIDSMVLVEAGHGFGASTARFRVDLSRFLMRSAPGDTGALLSGLITGDDGGLSKRANDAFLSTGTTHITAISGANFTIIILLLGVLATGAMRRNAVYLVTAVMVIWLYALMVGLQPSALRAALLATAVLLGRWMGRRPDLLTLTVLLAAVQIAVRPHDFHTLAFQLSIAATVALILVFGVGEQESSRLWPASLILAVIAAQLATIPILAWKIGTLSLTGLFANLIVGPAAEVVFPIALFGALLGQINSTLGEMVLLPAEWICQAIVAFVERVDSHAPGSVQLGTPTVAAIAVLCAVCWVGIALMSQDLRRTTRHGLSAIKSW
jgi:ComEC/Rec2-related protein